MTVFVPRTPSGYTIFCDDWRQEVTGKFIFIGVYQADIILFGESPQLLPQFAAVVHYLERPGESDLPVKLKMFVPGSDGPIVEVELPVAEARKSVFNSDDEMEDRVIRIMIPIKVAPLILQLDGLIKVRAYRGDDEIRLGTLKVRFQSPPPTPPT